MYTEATRYIYKSWTHLIVQLQGSTVTQITHLRKKTHKHDKKDNIMVSYFTLDHPHYPKESYSVDGVQMSCEVANGQT